MPAASSVTAPEARPADWLMVSILGLVWGSAFLLVELALRGITPFWLAAARIALAALALGAVQLIRRAPVFLDPAGPRPWGMIVAAGLMNTAIPFAALSWGQQYVTSAFAGVSMAAVPLFVLPLAHVLVPGERMTPRKVLGFLLGFGGIYLLIGRGALASTGAEVEILGRFACLGAALCYAINAILVRRLPPVDPLSLAATMLAVAAGVTIALALAVEGAPPLPDAQTLFWLAILGLLPTAAMNLLLVLVIRSAGPTFVALVNYMVPVWSVILGRAILGEPLPGSLLGALALILAGVALSQSHALRRLFRRAR